MAVRVRGLRHQAHGIAHGHRVGRGRHLHRDHLLIHRPLRASRHRPRGRGDHRRPVAGRRHQPGGVHRRDRGAAARPGHRGPGNHLTVLVANLGAQLHGHAQRRQLERGRSHRNRRRPGRLGRLRRVVAAASGPGDRAQQHGTHDEAVQSFIAHNSPLGCDSPCVFLVQEHMLCQVPVLGRTTTLPGEDGFPQETVAKNGPRIELPASRLKHLHPRIVPLHRCRRN